MYRTLEEELKKWQLQSDRYPLLIRGARQVGKSYLVENFAKKHFKNCVTINFEFQPELKACFESYDPSEIVNKIQLIMGVHVKEVETLLFLDEIQACPEAIVSLRYFREKMPNLHVIGAGSLLEFALQNSDFKMPVGRVQFMYLAPLSFTEFLTASKNEQLHEYLSAVEVAEVVNDTIHEKLMGLVRQYLILGGMPAVLRAYFGDGDMFRCQQIQSSLMQTYRSDFAKYAKDFQYKYLQSVFDAVPKMVGDRTKFSNIDADVKSRELKNALELLVLAGVVSRINLTAAEGLPFKAQEDERKFKMIFLDTGLMQNACGLAAKLAAEKDFMQVNKGAVAEQFVGQELKAYGHSFQRHDLHFWARDKRGSEAEVDYVIDIDSEVFPVEVKSGMTGSLKSLRLFIEEKKAKFGIRISREKLSFHDKVLSVPLYMIEQLLRIVRKL